MIKNLVFDLGNVLLSFRPEEFFIKKKYPENIRKKILTEIFQSREWAMLDNGDITTQEAIDSIASTSSLKKEEIELIFNLRSELIFPLDKNVRLLPGLKKRGFKLYYLSNFPLDIFEETKNGYFFFTYFDGGIISSEVKVSKPDIRIFNLLLEKYSLQPPETLFIDDVEANVKVAEKAGMTGMTTYGEENISIALEKVLNAR
jgi:putative hydrolase of the HAD superfamily